MMSEDIKFMLKRFPSFKEKIMEGYADNEEFRGLCEDIFSMTQTLERHGQKIFADPNHELEYRKLLLELEGELLKYLSSSREFPDARTAR
jgi:hypothetical protein